MTPKIAMCNIYTNLSQLIDFAHKHGFSGIDWSLEMETLPSTPSQETRWVNEITCLNSIEVRYHCPFHKVDLGHSDPEKAKSAARLFRRIIRLISRAGGKYLSIHIGLGRNSTVPLSWDETIDNLRQLVQYGTERNVKVCLENLAWGWTSKPNLFEKLIRRSGAGVTFDIGHAAVCESVRSQHYNIEDFITPHPNNIINAHLYDKEVSGVGHLPPEDLSDIESRLSLLKDVGCKWWVIEVKEEEGLLKTKEMVDRFLSRS